MKNPWEIMYGRLIKKGFLAVCYENEAYHALVFEGDAVDFTIKSQLEGVEQIIDFLSSNAQMPWVIGVTDRAIFHEVKQSDDNIELEKWLGESIPNGKSEDFLVEKNDLLVACMRVKQLDAALAPLQQFSRRLIQVSLSPVNIALLWQWQPSEMIGSYAIAGHSEQLSSIQYQHHAEGYSFGSIEIEAAQVGAFGAGIRLLSAQGDQVLPLAYAYSSEDWVYSFYFQLLKMPMLYVLLALLLINSVVFYILNEENARLDNISSNQQMLIKKLDKEKLYVSEHQEQYELLSSDHHFSQLLDQLGAAIPSKVKLTKVVLHPASANRKQKESGYEEGRLIIQGEVRDYMTYRYWLSAIQKSDWIESVLSQEFTLIDKNDESGAGVFELIIARYVE